uniref:dCMP deaminase n=1 Tax=Schistocephalus solidus TaxID=70667 RepID=A0A0X3PXE5_SCHSO
MTAPISEGVHGTPELNGVSLNDFSTASNVKRTDYLSWDEYFMSLAFLSAMRSKDPITQVGVCIINSEKKIVAVGYNGMPVGLSDDEMPWTKGLDDPLQNKHLYVCHAELNAVLNKNSADVKNCTLYSTLFPCNECAKVIIQCGIKEVVYFSDAKINKPQYNAAKIMFAKAGVKTTKRIRKPIIRSRPFQRVTSRRSMVTNQVLPEKWYNQRLLTGQTIKSVFSY